MTTELTPHPPQLLEPKRLSGPAMPVAVAADPTLPAGVQPTGVAIHPSGTKAYVVNAGNNTPSTSSVLVYDTTTFVSTPIAGWPAGSSPRGVAFTPNGSFAYVTAPGLGQLIKVNATTNTIIAGINVGGTAFPFGVATTPDNLFVYVTNLFGNALQKVSVATNTVVNTISVGSSPSGVAVSPNNLFVWVANTNSNTVSKVSVASNTVVATIPLGASPAGVAVSPDSAFVWVANTFPNTVTKIDAVANTVVATIPVGNAPQGLALSPDGSHLYVANNGGNSVSVINTASNSVTLTVPVGANPTGVAVNGSPSQVWVTNTSDNTVSVFDTVPFATTTTLSSAPEPTSFGQTKVLTATVTSPDGIPTGTVSFFDGVTLLGAAILAGGVATLMISALGVGSHSLTAVYSGDANFTGSTSPVDTQTVTQAATTTGLSSAPDPSVFGQAKTLTATVTAVPPGSGTPTGTVSFFDGVTLLGTAILAGGVATLMISALGVGSHSLTAVYSGDANFTGSTSPVDTQTVTQAATTTGLSSAPNPSTTGQTVVLTATVQATPPGSGTPTGTVSFFDGATLLGTAPLIAGSATLSSNTLSIGSHSLAAVYSGDTTFNPSTGTTTQVVNSVATTTTVTATPNPSVCGQSVMVCAQVATVPPGGTPTGSVLLTGPGGLSQTVPVNASGQACFTSTTLQSGTVTAIYTPTGTFTGSSGNTTVTVNQVASTTTVTATPNPSTPGQAVTVCANVTVPPGSPTPTGSVIFTGPGGLSQTVPVNASGQACFTSTTLTTGTITAIYTGNTCTSASLGTASVTVQPPVSCAITVTPPSGTVTVGQPTTLSATVTCNGAPVPNAAVTFTSNSAIIGFALTNASGIATTAVIFTTQGANTVTATVTAAGTACTCTNVTSTPVTITVQPAGSTFKALPACYRLSFPPLPWSFATTTLTATGAPPGATITFHSDGPGGPVLCTAVADTNGNATCTANLTVFQLTSGYTATTPAPGGLLTSSNTLTPCL